MSLLIVFLLAGFVFAVLLVGCATTGPTKTDQPITREEINQFLRKWEGTWYDWGYPGNLDASLEIVKDEQAKILIIYSWGDSIQWRIEKGRQLKEVNFLRRDGKVILFFGKSRGGNNFEFYLDKNGDLTGQIANTTTFITMYPAKTK